MNTYPTSYKFDSSKKSLTAEIFGNRFRTDQTLYEYLIEFLLVYSSAKDEDLVTGKNSFHKDISDLHYWVEPRMGLRRFVFFDKSRKKGTIPADEKAYKELIKILMDKMDGISDEDERLEIIESIQDLFHGYAVVIKNRFWGAQGLLPICPEFMFCGCDPNLNQRRNKVDWENDPISIDNNFEFSKRNFLSKGGELYYLHLLQGLENRPEERAKLESLLNNLILDQCKKISDLANFIQTTWEEKAIGSNEKISQKLNCSFIPADAYKECEEYAISELINYLSCSMHPINKIDVLAKGVMFQIMRMMANAVAKYLGVSRKTWIVDMKGTAGDTVKKLAAASYSDIESDFMTAINSLVAQREEEGGEGDEKRIANVQKAKSDTLDVFRAKGKELQCIIPVSGPFERFSLSEDVIRFLVLAIVKPGEKMTVSMFLKKLYEHYGIVIGPEEYKASLNDNHAIKEALSSSFTENVVAFQQFLKGTGFLRELSDATSIVVNPYQSLEGEV